MTRTEPWSSGAALGQSWSGEDVTYADPESTQAWSMPADEEPAGMPEPPPPVPAWAAASSSPPPADTIVPDSWFAEPRQQQQQGPGAPNEAWPELPPVQPNQTTVLDSGFGGYSGLPGAYQAPPRSGGNGNKPLLIIVGALVAVALVAVGIVMWPDGDGKANAGSSPSAAPRNATQKQPPRKPSGPAHDQAVAVNELLNASADTRGQINQAIATAAKCENLPTAIAGFQRVAQRRTNQINRTRALKLGEVPKGERLRAALLRSFRLSLQVDQAFLAWAQAAQGCTGATPHDGNHQRGVTLSGQATAAKRRAAALWNPVANKQQLPTRTDQQF